MTSDPIVTGLAIATALFVLSRFWPSASTIESGYLARYSGILIKLKLYPTYDLAMKKIGTVPRETYHKAFILSQVMPSDLVPEVLDLAGLWIDAPLVSTVYPFKATEKNAGTPYLVAELPPTFPAKGLRSLTFTITSRDQGWSWDTVFHGTLKHSYTWFEVAVLPPDYENRVDSKGAKLPVPGKRIFVNIHAEKQYYTHAITWSYNDDDEEIRKILRNLRPGDKIAITVWAQFRAWVNDVRSARIDCQVNAVRKM
jgi:hypothetical protein